MEPDRCDQSPACSLAGAIGRRERLFEVIQRGLLASAQHAGVEPCAVEVAGARVLIVLLAVARLFLAKLDLHEVVGRELQIPLAHLRRDLVVGLGENVSGFDSLRVVEDSAKRLNLRHAVNPSVPSRYYAPTLMASSGRKPFASVLI